ncbi:MAG: hypothetical protein WCX73_05790 [Candidatus Pacearchaeota archaeon]|jgi:hypothetical protein
MNWKYYAKYGGIAAISFGAGFCEEFFESPKLINYSTNIGVPILSMMLGGSIEIERYHKEFGGDTNEGFGHVVDITTGAISGGLLSLICEVSGIGIGKLAKHLSK